MLRATNIAFATGILVVVSRLLKLLHPGTDSTRLILYALALGCFPVSMFYTFLYYTDSGSTFFVLLSYLLSKQRRYIMSGLVRHWSTISGFKDGYVAFLFSDITTRLYLAIRLLWYLWPFDRPMSYGWCSLLEFQQSTYSVWTRNTTLNQIPCITLRQTILIPLVSL
jgi:hypothetical protein